MAHQNLVPWRFGPSRESLHHRLGAIVLCVAAALCPPGTFAAEPTVEKAAAVDQLDSPRARVIGQLPTLVRYRLDRAFPVAVALVRDVAECRELFAVLGADGLEKLERTIYLPPQPGEGQTCRGRVTAFTGVGQPHTRLCPAFADLTHDQAVTILLHEALHFAGLSERPLDPRGLTPLQINRMVEAACGH